MTSLKLFKIVKMCDLTDINKIGFNADFKELMLKISFNISIANLQ